MSDEPKKMSIAEFREQGYLQELNRQFLHPLGLALEVVREGDGTERLGGVWDYRDDPEGMIYGPNMIDAGKTQTIFERARNMAVTRKEKLGFFIQPAPQFIDLGN